jgi:osmotically-inducible protein OsmY
MVVETIVLARDYQSAMSNSKTHRRIGIEKMLTTTKYLFMTAVLCYLVLLESQAALAASTKDIKVEVESRISASEQLGDTSIEVHVEGRLVVLTGRVRLYEQKLVGERLAWTTPGVFEVDNELRVVPGTPLSDTAIARKIRDIVYKHEQFRVADVVVNVKEGRVRLQGSFLGYSDPTELKHRIAQIEGVVEIYVGASFLSRLENSPGSADVD